MIVMNEISTKSFVNDGDLLQAIARNQDSEAFAELYRRFHRQAYGLAYRISGRHDVAEEALQTAMINVWRKAASFDPEGNLRGWIMRIVSRATLSILRKVQGVNDMRERSIEQLPATADSPAVKAEGDEMLACLSGVLDKLPSELKAPILLYYGGGLTQEEIGQALDVPRRTIAKSIQDGLEKLRVQLSGAGFGAAIPLLTSKGIADAIEHGMEPPSTLYESILRTIREEPSRISTRVRAHSGKPWVATGVAVALVALGGTWFLVEQQQSVVTSPTPLTPLGKEASTLIRRRWDFTNGPAQDLTVLQGMWQWKHDGERGYMYVPQVQSACVSLPIEIRKHPLKITMTMNSKGRLGRGGGDVYWVTGNKIPHLQICGKQYPFQGTSIHFEHYLFDRYLVTLLEGKVSHVSVYDQPFPGDRLIIVIGNLSVLSIDIEEIEVDHLPALCRDPKALIESLNDPLKEGEDSGKSFINGGSKAN